MDWWQMLLIFLIFIAVGLAMGRLFTQQIFKNGILDRNHDTEAFDRKPLKPELTARDYA